jgi:hypothetical protein
MDGDVEQIARAPRIVVGPEQGFELFAVHRMAASRERAHEEPLGAGEDDLDIAHERSA